MDHGSAAGGPAHPLEPPVEEQQDGHGRDRTESKRRETEDQHDSGRQGQTERHEKSRIGAVRDRAHEEFAQPVGDGHAGQGETQLGPAVTLLDEIGHGEGEVLAQKVVARIADEDPTEDLKAEAPVGGRDFVGWKALGGLGWSENADHALTSREIRRFPSSGRTRINVSWGMVGFNRSLPAVMHRGPDETVVDRSHMGHRLFVVNRTPRAADSPASEADGGNLPTRSSQFAVLHQGLSSSIELSRFADSVLRRLGGAVRHRLQ